MPPTIPNATQPATSWIGWSSGTAAQLSLPIMVFLPALGCARTGLNDRSRTWRQRLLDDLIEQIWLDRRVRERSDIHALLRELLIGLRGERRGGSFAGLVDPGRETVLR